MPTQVAELFVQLTLEQSAFRQQLEEAAREVTSFEQQLDSLQSQAESLLTPPGEQPTGKDSPPFASPPFEPTSASAAPTNTSDLAETLSSALAPLQSLQGTGEPPATNSFESRSLDPPPTSDPVPLSLEPPFPAPQPNISPLPLGSPTTPAALTRAADLAAQTLPELAELLSTMAATLQRIETNGLAARLAAD